MRNKYKLPWHIKQYVKKELMDYKGNRNLLEKYKKTQGNTRDLILIKTRLTQIENVFERLYKEEREAAELIFFDHYSQPRAEIAKGISKSCYYYTMDKVIYLTAAEMELI